MSLQALNNLRLIEQGLKFKEVAMGQALSLYSQYGQGYVKQACRLWKQCAPELNLSSLKSHTLGMAAIAFLGVNFFNKRTDVIKTGDSSGKIVINNRVDAVNSISNIKVVVWSSVAAFLYNKIIDIIRGKK